MYIHSIVHVLTLSSLAAPLHLSGPEAQLAASQPLAGDGTIAPTTINFPGLEHGLKSLIGAATTVLTYIAAGFFAFLLGLACLAYAWNHNNPRRLQESRTAIMRVLEAAALFGLIGVLLGLVNAVVSFASKG